MQWAEFIATGTAVLSILCFVLYAISILRMPTGRRPRIVPMDRLGHPLPPSTNPDFRDTEEEQHALGVRQRGGGERE
jgi:hypothetical protein